MVVPSAAPVNDTLGISIPLSAKLIYSLAVATGATPLEFIPTFCPKAFFENNEDKKDTKIME